MGSSLELQIGAGAIPRGGSCQLSSRPVPSYSSPIQSSASQGKIAQLPQLAVSGTVSSPVSAVPAHPQAPGWDFGCSELHVPLLGASSPPRPPTGLAALRTQVAARNHKHKYCSAKYSFSLGTGCPLEGPLWHGVKQSRGLPGLPAAMRQGWGSCSHSGAMALLATLGDGSLCQKKPSELAGG